MVAPKTKDKPSYSLKKLSFELGNNAVEKKPEDKCAGTFATLPKLQALLKNSMEVLNKRFQQQAKSL